MSLLKLIIGTIACILLWFAVDHGREEKIQWGSKDWWIIFFLLLTSTIVIGNLDKWIEE
jgi:hypothetical protein